MNKKLLGIFNDDQKDRHNPMIRNNASLLTKNDRERRRVVQGLISIGKLVSAEDYYHAAMIFQHGGSILDSVKAVRFSKISHELGYKKALAFYATCLDRLLLKRGKKQKFGTQSWKKDARSTWVLSPVDSRTTDKERKQYDIAPLKELEDRIEKLNRESGNI
jgi:hypothetical protein